ncbi:SDR family NAD(P)-dependent oxidoreductase [Sphingopyxis granuli]|uniref:SDR family NAD(P)-dependent oxidoreductase n=1 Tax=Sphingopyxis granuli TaxID=267128 RepID=UPI000836741A|nr:SDR family NAD(P)-dependent oxidoreductase [Sphingopyxis granuli]
MREFEGRTAVITGGASGIGLAFAHLFGRNGCRIMLADIESTALDSAVEGLRKAGIAAFGEIADVADPASVERLAARTFDRFGKVHLLFNNAGVSITGPTWRMSPDDWRWVWDVNVWGVVNGIRAFLPAMMAHGEEAHVINTGSLASFFGNGDHAPYCSSKAAVLGISQSLYSEMRAMKTRVGVTIVCPGMVATRIHQSWRNRPDADRPWSDREYADLAFREGSEAFQGAGLSPDVIAEATLDAVRNDRFYSFSGDRWPFFIRGALEPTLRGDNPPVATWGEDRRSEEERAPAPWAAAASGA